ncbi:MAG TPA: ATP-binding protein [Paraburkholderia sp.]|uniref:sensor histidine kinase n=1 Tax=Paraburkholderia sp. TaxID=1926495 RepID=UPI002B491754|nr:ATP-binding protein [Paraburkholderia sp.]HKR42901.1 ATP-binding protein [Paraburkholderia sp.]
MDGVKKRLKESIQFRLSVALSVAILVVATAAAAFSFSSAYVEAHEFQDDVLRQIATLLDRQSAPMSASPTGSATPTPESDEAPRVIVEPLKRDGAPLAAGDRRLAGAATLPDGFHTLDADGQTLRVLIHTLANGERIAVAQDGGVRDDTAREGAWRTAMPLIILLPILLLVVADLVRKMLRPVASLSAEIDARSEHDLQPVETVHVPVEMRPFVVAINRMLGRVAQSVDAQRRFVADAAHELRSPLTAMSLQAERLGETDLPVDARTRLTTLRGGLERSRKLIEQLLALARIQTEPARPMEPVSIHATWRRVLEDLMPLAEAKHIDIGVEDGADVRVSVDSIELTTLIRNLVDNAIRYTPDGGRVNLAVRETESQALLTVADNGPGIAPHERARVFDPFYRIPGNEQIGSGLGLAIVRTIADRMGAEVSLAPTDTHTQRGLRVSVRIPPQSR